MKKNNNIPDQRAFRLLEALGGVDAELIARSEQTLHGEDALGKETMPTSDGNKTGMERSNKLLNFATIAKYARKYSSSWAAVLCVAVVGALAWGGYNFISDNFRMGSAQNAMDSVMEGIQWRDEESGNATPFSSAAAARPESAVSDEMLGADGMMNENISQATGTAESDKIENFTPESKADIGYMGGTATLESTSRKLASLEKAREIEVLGDMIPTILPAGYVFESAYYGEGNSGKLNLCWTRGMDSIFWHVQVVEDVNSLHIVDVSKEETYNEYLYEIPLAETLPEEYREIFQNPVCKLEDFSLEFVQKRMIYRGADAGDTTTPRGNFTVLYPGNCLVQFNGRGTAEEIYEMFQSIEIQ